MLCRIDIGAQALPRHAGRSFDLKHVTLGKERTTGYQLRNVTLRAATDVGERHLPGGFGDCLFESRESLFEFMRFKVVSALHDPRILAF